MSQDSLVTIPVEKWTDLQTAFKSDWPRGIIGYTILKTQKQLIKDGFDYGFKVLCPYNDVKAGIVAINKKDTLYEIVIQCPIDDTTKLEEALKSTKEIDWTKNIVVPFAPSHVMECVKRMVDEVNVNIELILPSYSMLLHKDTRRFEVNLPPGITFHLLSTQHIDLVNSTWPHRYTGSEWYFQLLIKTHSGFGLFKENALVSWVFINERGTLGHMYTLEAYRRLGLAKLLLKVVCNQLLAEGKDVLTFALKSNESACKLYHKVGFTSLSEVSWCYLKSRS